MPSTEVVELSSLTDEELEMYKSKRLSMFKLTILVCVLYGVLALILLLLALFTSWGQRVLYDEMLAFVITFIVGTIIIIVFLANEIYNFQPTKIDQGLPYDAEMCPDYWKLELVDDDSFIDNQGRSFLSTQVNKNQFRYKCVLDDSLFTVSKFKEADNKKSVAEKRNYDIGNNNRLYVTVEGTTPRDRSKVGLTKESDFENFKKYAANMNGYTYTDTALIKNNNQATSNINVSFNKNKVPLSCDTVYPLYMSIIDKTNINKNPSDPSNKYRCAYAKACGITWTEAGCA